ARAAPYPRAPGAPHAVRGLGARVHLRHERAGRHAAAAAGRVRHAAGAGLHPHRGGGVRAGCGHGPAAHRVHGAAVDGGHAATGEKTRMTLIELSHISLTYPNAAAPALSDLTLAVEEGATLSILGPSGCGKTTVLRAIAGFERPQAGAITIAGRSVGDAVNWVVPEERGVGMVFQDYALFPHLTVAENVTFGLQRLEKTAATRTVTQTLDLVGLTGFEDRYTHELSGGQQQRVALARALAPKPIVLLLEEPFSNMDPDLRGR